MRNHVITTMFDPGSDLLPWIVVKVYQDGNPIQLGRYKTEEEADDFIHDLNVLDLVLKS